MGVIVRKEFDKDTELSDRIAADLRDKARENSDIMDDPDFSNAEYAKDLKSTSRFGWVWFVLVALAIISLVLIVVI